LTVPRFAFAARDADGNAVRGFETAMDLPDLDRQLTRAGLLLVEARPARRRRQRRGTDRGLIDFCYHLSVVVEAGIPITQGLRDLRDQGVGSLSDAVSDVLRKLEAGCSLSDALAERPREFPQLVRALVRAGERTGRLDQILADLVRHLEWREELRRQIKSATTYPSIVIAGVLGLCALIATYVLPNFIEIFVDLGVSLPPTTRALIASQQFVSVHGVELLLAGALILGAAFAWARTRGGRRFFHATALRIPVVGRLVRMTEASRFSHNLGLLYSSGLPLVTCLELVEEIVQNTLIRELVCDVRGRLGRGEGLGDSLRRSELLPLVVLRMVSIGEASGRLDEALERAASFFDREVPALIARVLALFNTGTLLFLGAALVTIALSLFVPLYTMLGNLNADQF
jgi:type IV pilus assembly protein PilC